MARGELRIYLGAAPGVGKTFAMLNEGRRRRAAAPTSSSASSRPTAAPKTAAQIGDLEVVPRAQRRRTAARRSRRWTSTRSSPAGPQVALVDELAHTNVPGSRNEKRWQDVEELLDAGIDVISTLNVQHLESLNDVVERITGVKQQETIPDEVVRRADQIELVDMTPEALRRRMAHGNIYPPEQIDAALANYFRAGNLAALRELALLWVADRVDEALLDYRERHGIDRPWETRERVVVALTGLAGRRAARPPRGADGARAKGDLVGVHVRPQDGLAAPVGRAARRAARARRGARRHVPRGRRRGRRRGARRAARTLNATQIVLGASRRSRWQS